MIPPSRSASDPDTTEPNADVGPGPSPSPFVPDELLRRDRVPGYAWWLLGTLVVLGIGSLILTSMRRGGLAALFVYSIPSNTAISLLPHEPMLLIYGGRANLWVAAAVATAGTVVAGWLDHRIFVPMLNLERVARYKSNRLYRRTMQLFSRAPFAAIVLAGLTPVPFWPFKLLAFSGGYALGRYLTAVAVGRLPRYTLILWVGAAFPIPVWVLVAATLAAFLAYCVHLVIRGPATTDG